MYDIAYITDSGYLLPTAISMKSLIESAEGERVRIHVVSHGLETREKASLLGLRTPDAEIRIVDSAMEFPDIADEHLYVTKSALCKFCLPSLLPDLDNVLYIDGDTLVHQGFLDIFENDISNCYAAVIMDLLATRNNEHARLGTSRYFNSGVMYLNLGKMRSDGISEKLIHWRATNSSKYMDNDAFNAVFGEKVLYIELKYNCQTLYGRMVTEEDVLTFFNADVDDLRSPAISHFTGSGKPWRSCKAGAVEKFAADAPSAFALPVALNWMKALDHEVAVSLSAAHGGNPKRPYCLGANMLSHATDGVVLDGFADEEAWGRWTTGPARILVQSNDFQRLSSAARLNLRISSFAAERSATISFNGEIVHEGPVPSGDSTLDVDVALDKARLSESNVIEIAPDGGRLFSPSELKLGDDTRKLAFGVHFVRMVENSACAFSGMEERLARLDAQIAELRDALGNMHNSPSYKIGRAITWLPRKMRQLL